MQLTPQNWQAKWSELAITKDTPLSLILAEKAPAISTLNKGKPSVKNGIAVFAMFIASVCEYMGVEWSQYQRDECAQSAFDEYYYLSLPELRLFYQRLKSSWYTRKDLSRFAPIHLMAWLEQFADEVLEARRIAADKKPAWTPPKNPVSDEVFNAGISQLVDQMDGSVKDIENEDEFKRLRAEYNTKRMQQNPPAQGKTVLILEANGRIKVIDKK